MLWGCTFSPLTFVRCTIKKTQPPHPLKKISPLPSWMLRCFFSLLVFGHFVRGSNSTETHLWKKKKKKHELAHKKYFHNKENQHQQFHQTPINKAYLKKKRRNDQHIYLPALPVPFGDRCDTCSHACSSHTAFWRVLTAVIGKTQTEKCWNREQQNTSNCERKNLTMR